MKILIVDDEFNSCELLAGKIRSMGFEEIEEVLCAASGESALEVLQKAKCEILITDICMSPMDGLELVCRAREKNPKIACVLLSAYDEFSYAQRGIQLGIQDYWLKPYREEQVRDTIWQLVREYRSNRQRSKFVLDALVNEAIFSGDKEMKDIFPELSSLPGEARAVLWRGIGGQEPELPGRWTYYVQGKSLLFLFPAGSQEEDAALLGQILEGTGKRCGVSLPGSRVAELYRQAGCALAAAWVNPGNGAAFYREFDQAGLQSAVADMVRRAVALPGEEIMEELRQKQKEMEPFPFSWFIHSLNESLAQELADMGGKRGNVSPNRQDQGWEPVLRKALEAVARAKREQMEKGRREPIQWVKEYIREHYGEELDMTVIANKLDISYQYFSRLFHAQTGSTFSEYILNIRMKEACRLLLQGELVSVVAKRVGYQHPHNFARAFKKMYGVSPNAFRGE